MKQIYFKSIESLYVPQIESYLVVKKFFLPSQCILNLGKKSQEKRK